MMHAERPDLPLLVEGAENFVERNYREGGRFQWVRETLVNGIENGATRIEFGTEWQGVEASRVYRRTIADNGCGMTPTELQTFFRTYGGSGKAIGGMHENFGIGAKCSLFPWNTAGVVIVSWHPEFEEASLIWVRKDPETGTYGLVTWDTPEGGLNVIAAGPDSELGIDWSRVKPEWIDDHGTVLVLLGDSLDDDTVLGDPHRDEGGVPGRGIAEYLNRRMWDLEGVTVKVDEYGYVEKANWPASPATQRDGKTVRGWRPVEGAKYYIEYTPAVEAGTGRIAEQGSFDLSDGTKLDWYLWEGGGREGIRSAPARGLLAASYVPPDNRTVPELFDVFEHPSRFRAFGISETDVRKRLWLIARPPTAAEGTYGVYMSSDRNRLLIQGGPKAGDPLPWEDWAIEFADDLPDPIVKAIRQARASHADTELDDTWRDRLAERFGRRWRQIKLRVEPGGPETTDPASDGGRSTPSDQRHAPRRKASREQGPSPTGGLEGKREGGADPARRRRTPVGVPEAEWTDDEEQFEPGMFAVWNPPSQANPAGLVQLNLQHPVFLEELGYWKNQYPPHLEEDVKGVIQTAYAQLAVATVAHSESLRPHLERADDVDDKLRAPAALTASLLGLVGPSAIITPTLSGKLGVKRRDQEDGT